MHQENWRNELGKGRATAILADGIKKSINKLAFSKKSRIFVAKNIKKNGYVRARVDGEIYELAEEDIKLEKTKKHNIEAVIDRLIIKEGMEGRLSDSLEAALRLAEGLVIINVIGDKDILFSENFACADCGISIQEFEPRMFSLFI